MAEAMLNMFMDRMPLRFEVEAAEGLSRPGADRRR